MSDFMSTVQSGSLYSKEELHALCDEFYLAVRLCSWTPRVRRRTEKLTTEVTLIKSDTACAGGGKLQGGMQRKQDASQNKHLK